MILGVTQLLREMCTKNISWRGEGAQCIVLTALPSSCADCVLIWEPQPPGILKACPGFALDFYYAFGMENVFSC